MRAAMIAVVAMALSVGAAQAQTPPTTGAQNTNDGAAKAQAAVPIAGVDNATLADSARASKLIGSKVYHGDSAVGQIEDVLVDLDKASVRALVLSVGGVLGVGDKRVAVPVSAMKIGKEARFVTELTKDQLSNAPAFDLGTLQ
jgi:sporulation protein YlmC with PRC-barrel domain